jgi:hypothetical protein
MNNAKNKTTKPQFKSGLKAGVGIGAVIGDLG